MDQRVLATASDIWRMSRNCLGRVLAGSLQTRRTSAAGIGLFSFPRLLLELGFVLCIVEFDLRCWIQFLPMPSSPLRLSFEKNASEGEASGTASNAIFLYYSMDCNNQHNLYGALSRFQALF